MALTGMSAASAGAADKASAATTDKTTFFIDPAPFQFDRLSHQPIQFARHTCVQTPAAIDLYATGRALGANLDLESVFRAMQKKQQLLPF
jgi:hypothetical protein